MRRPLTRDARSVLQSRPGTYALILRASRPRRLEVGGLGFCSILPGFYVYVGSARGPGGVRARVGRHARRPHVRHWHVDYLLGELILHAVWHTYDPVPREHIWAQVFRDLPRASVPLLGFGASDCRCSSHLLFFEQPPAIRAFRNRLRAILPAHSAVFQSWGPDLASARRTLASQALRNGRSRV